MDKSTVAAPVHLGKTVASQGKKKPAKKSVAAKASHPKTSDMVNAAIKELKERGGSSLQAIKKYISANYNVDAEKMAPFIRNYLKTAVTSGSLVQTKGKGASGSFKLVAGEKASGKKKAVSPKVKAPEAKKAKTAAKKSPAVKRSPGGAKTVKSKPATPSKIKKAKKVPTKKPKAPKPKTVGAAKPKAVKKTATGGLKKK